MRGADFNKDFQGATVVLPDVAQRRLGFLGQQLQAMNIARGQLIKLTTRIWTQESRP